MHQTVDTMYEEGNFDFMKKNSEKYKLYFDTITTHNLWNHIKNSKSFSVWFDNELEPVFTEIYKKELSTEKYSVEFNEFSNYIYVMKQIIDIGWSNYVYDYIEDMFE
jgi:hypothetical protein